MIEKMQTQKGDSNYPCRSKINEIIDKLNEISRNVPENNKTWILNCATEMHDFDQRLINLEKYSIRKPEYQPEDVAINVFEPQIIHELAEKGTFEWSIIQMKKGKKVRRKKWSPFRFVSIADPDMRFDLHKVAIMSSDWEVYEIQSTGL